MFSCPRCKTVLIKGERGHCCRSCGFQLPYVFRGHRLTEKELNNLLTEGSTGKHDKWQTKDGGRRLRGQLILTADFRLSFTAERITYANCPRCKQGLYRFSHGIMCSACDFTVFDKVASRKISGREMMQLLVYRRTDKLERFVSADTGKYFTARLIIDDAGDVQFQF